MTNDAITEAARIKAIIAALTSELTAAVNQIDGIFPSLTVQQRATLKASVRGQYQALIDVQQTAFADLSGDFVKSEP